MIFLAEWEKSALVHVTGKPTKKSNNVEDDDYESDYADVEEDYYGMF